MTSTEFAPRDRASDFSDAVIAAYIHDISARRRPQRAEARGHREEAVASTRTRRPSPSFTRRAQSLV